MKKILPLFALLLSLAASRAADLSFAWTAPVAAPPATHYKLYERTGTSPNYVYTEVGTTTAPVTSFTLLNVTPALHFYVVTSIVRYLTPAPTDIESVYSVAAWWAPRPAAPTDLRITELPEQAALPDFQNWFVNK